MVGNCLPPRTAYDEVAQNLIITNVHLIQLNRIMPLGSGLFAMATPQSTIEPAVLPQQVSYRRLIRLKRVIQCGPVSEVTWLLWVRRHVRISASIQKNPADFQMAVHCGG